ncbi:glyoxalase family protein [Paenibacillus sp. UNC496MF]|uniref:ring-cleaving dioxygenase n=1 Tax=Paenibacillus sp. UNC496MF TaxID=1502753 RepID=UPI0008F0926B|nr:ring-cleaving dioxygenase [Paenibacillus sp. UNC496MF]SFJ15246.1 glyoxalase family protein [Paenibacillus sp. UNC496MF]
MTYQTAGIHHITSFVRHPQDNVDFYAGLLGLRLVKKTINFDAPDVYHLYFGNEIGGPGTIMTFFPSEGARLGKVGGGQVGYTTFAVPAGALPFWAERLTRFGIAFERTSRFGETYLQFKDGDGLQLELVEREEGAPSKWTFGGIPLDKAIKGFGGAILYSVRPDRTRDTLENVMGLTKVAEENGLVRYRAGGDIGNVIDINADPMPWGDPGAGTVHHIAWRAASYEDHAKWRDHVIANGFHATDIIDRQYFNAIYYREAGGILFEIATDAPGFQRDEPYDTLGEKLMLPSWYEPKRGLIEQNLFPIQVRELEANER